MRESPVLQQLNVPSGPSVFNRTTTLNNIVSFREARRLTDSVGFGTAEIQVATMRMGSLELFAAQFDLPLKGEAFIGFLNQGARVKEMSKVGIEADWQMPDNHNEAGRNQNHRKGLGEEWKLFMGYRRQFMNALGDDRDRRNYLNNANYLLGTVKNTDQALAKYQGSAQVARQVMRTAEGKESDTKDFLRSGIVASVKEARPKITRNMSDDEVYLHFKSLKFAEQKQFLREVIPKSGLFDSREQMHGQVMDEGNAFLVKSPRGEHFYVPKEDIRKIEPEGDVFTLKRRMDSSTYRYRFEESDGDATKVVLDTSEMPGLSISPLLIWAKERKWVFDHRQVVVPPASSVLDVQRAFGLDTDRNANPLVGALSLLYLEPRLVGKLPESIKMGPRSQRMGAAQNPVLAPKRNDVLASSIVLPAIERFMST